MARPSIAGALGSERQSYALKLDPNVLPVRYVPAAVQARGDGRQAQVYLDRDRVIMKRAVGDKIAMTVTLPVSAYRGVAARLHASEGGSGFVASVTLLHDDEALTLPLYVGDAVDELIAEWQAWGDALNLPLMIFDEAGQPQRVAAGEVVFTAFAPLPRRRGAFFAARRPRFLARRKRGLSGAMPVHAHEHEIIAPE